MAASRSHGLVDGRSYPLKIGSSFQPNKASESYHTLRYDFKPASVDTSRPAEVHIGAKNECSVTIPNVHDSGTTTYKGGKKPCTKECILIIDKETGEITLERISSNIPLKRSRADRTVENTQKPAPIKNTPTMLNKHKPHLTNVPSKPVPPVPNNLQNNQSKSSTRDHVIPPQPIKPKARERSATSTSDSNSSSSDSSGSESGDEGEVEALTFDTFSTKAYEPPPPAQPATKINPGGSFISTLHSDLQLSDSNSDSD